MPARLPVPTYKVTRPTLVPPVGAGFVGVAIDSLYATIDAKQVAASALFLGALRG